MHNQPRAQRFMPSLMSNTEAVSSIVAGKFFDAIRIIMNFCKIQKSYKTLLHAKIALVLHRGFSL